MLCAKLAALDTIERSFGWQYLQLGLGPWHVFHYGAGQYGGGRRCDGTWHLVAMRVTLVSDP